MQFISADQKRIAKTTIGHHADHLQILATVDCPPPARITLATIHIRFDTALVAWFDVCHTVAGGNDFDAQFVAGDARKIEEGIFLLSDAVI